MAGRLKQISHKAVALAIAVGLLAAVTAGCGSSGGDSSSSTTAASASASDLASIHGTYSPSIDPADFVKTIDNRYFPLKPGTTFLYKGVHENGKTPQTDKEIVTHRTKQILGVTCTVINRHRFLVWKADRADLRLVCPGQGRERLVHG
jgi:hypothetical protein